MIHIELPLFPVKLLPYIKSTKTALLFYLILILYVCTRSISSPQYSTEEKRGLYSWTGGGEPQSSNQLAVAQ
jgi:hypothetical protein